VPDRDVKTIRFSLFFQYAKIIGVRAFGPNARKTVYGFTKTKFRELVRGEMKWSEILRNDQRSFEEPKACIYCGAADHLQWEHIVPRSLANKERCPGCDRIQGIHNMVWRSHAAVGPNRAGWFCAEKASVPRWETVA
jgi:hypothetical protein